MAKSKKYFGSTDYVETLNSDWAIPIGTEDVETPWSKKPRLNAADHTDSVPRPSFGEKKPK